MTYVQALTSFNNKGDLLACLVGIFRDRVRALELVYAVIQ